VHAFVRVLEVVEEENDDGGLNIVSIGVWDQDKTFQQKEILTLLRGSKGSDGEDSGASLVWNNQLTFELQQCGYPDMVFKVWATSVDQ